MKVLLDENHPHELRRELTAHEVLTVQYQGWSGTRNGVLLSLAAASGFDVMVTMDCGIPYQQNAALPLAVVVIRAASNDMDVLRPIVPRLLEILQTLKPKTFVEIG